MEAGDGVGEGVGNGTICVAVLLGTTGIRVLGRGVDDAGEVIAVLVAALVATCVGAQAATMRLANTIIDLYASDEGIGTLSIEIRTVKGFLIQAVATAERALLIWCDYHCPNIHAIGTEVPNG